MRPSKKNRLFNFIFAFFPGASEMYMGFMKLGLSMMSIFALLIMIPGFFRLNDIFMMPVFVMEAYSFFHARNLSKCDDQTFCQICDHFIWEEFDGVGRVKLNLPGARKWAAVALILFGANILWKYISNLIYVLIPNRMWDRVYGILDGIPSVVLAVFIICIGIRLIIGKKRTLELPEAEYDKEAPNGENG